MRRFIYILLAVALLAVVAVPVLGANAASRVQVVANVNSDESCQVSVTANLHIEQAGGQLRFPVPVNATGIAVNGSTRVSTETTDTARYILLSEVVGDFTLLVQYSLPDVIETGTADSTVLQLPLLSGYENSISHLEFTVTLPGSVTAKPSFSSGYHQANIEKDLSVTSQGNTVSGYSLTELKDHETLTMTLPVEKTLFPNAPIVFFESDSDDTAMWICAIAALLYWLFFLRCIPPRRRHSTSPPEGIGAGQLGSVLTLGRSDLSLMVFTWAQLGYLQILMQNSGRVILQKRMEMGNERTGFEQRCFHGLFGKRDRVDTGSLGYAAYCKKVAKMKTSVHSYVRARSGNPKLMRAISATVALFAGVNFGISLSQDSALQGLWIFLIATVCLVCGWYMQQTAAELYLIKSRTTYGGLAASFFFLLLAYLSGHAANGITVMLFQWVAGALAFYGGRRTDAGRQDYARVLGLRHYLRSVSKDELRRIQLSDPDYFHALAPYALALGVDKAFARRFGGVKLPESPYLIAGKTTDRTAQQWSKLMRNALKSMKQRSRILPLERLMGLFGSSKR